MKKEIREIYFDKDLRLEAYQLKGVLQAFPMHFHEYYVIGYIDKGHRHMVCKQGEYDISEKDMILFNPFDHHHCYPLEKEEFLIFLITRLVAVCLFMIYNM